MLIHLGAAVEVSSNNEAQREKMKYMFGHEPMLGGVTSEDAKDKLTILSTIHRRMDQMQA